MSAINSFLLSNNLTIAGNPCVSPDFCLDWTGLVDRLASGETGIFVHPKSAFSTAAGVWSLVEDLQSGDCAWRFEGSGSEIERGGLVEGVRVGEAAYFPANWQNLLRLKNLVQEHDPESTIFPTAGGRLGQSTLGVGARFTTLHWPAVEWAMSALELGVTANQNSIPRELVYDVDAMLETAWTRSPSPLSGRTFRRATRARASRV